MKIVLLGESFHGAKEFYIYKLNYLKDLIERNFKIAVIFETDYLGVNILNDDINVLIQKAFPKIFKTNEIKEILELLKDNKIPFYGMDCRMRLSNDLVPEKYKEEYEFNLKVVEDYNFSNEYFEYRDKFMSNKVIEIALKNDLDYVVVLTHNLHIKKCGSMEINPVLKLKSLREHLDETNFDVESIGMFGVKGTYWEIDLEEKSFVIDYPDSFERSISFNSNNIAEIDCNLVDEKYYAYNYGIDKDSRPIKLNYNKAVLFNTLSMSILLSHYGG